MRLGLVVVVLVAGCRLWFDEVAPPEDADDDSALAHDEDGDGVPDPQDNCPHVAGPQDDMDGDRVGDVCDPTPTDPRQELVLFDPVLDGRGFTVLSSAWQETGDGLLVNAPGEFAEIARAVTFTSGVVEAGVEIRARAPSAPQYQVSLAVREADLTTPFHYVEVWESALPGYASVSYFDGTTYTPIATIDLGSGVHVGTLRLAYGVSPPAPTIAVAALWPAEPYGTGTNFGGYPGRHQIRFGIQNLEAELRYLVVINTN